MRKIILFIIGISLITISCQNHKIEKEFQNDFEKATSFIDSRIVNHFPKKLPYRYIFGTTLPRMDTLKYFGFGCDRIELSTTYTEKVYDSLKMHFNNIKVKEYSASDTSLLLIFSFCDTFEVDGYIFRDQETPEKQKLAKNNITIAKSLPIPLFYIEEYSGNTLCGLSKDFTIFVLGVEHGEYMNEKYLQECDCLPPNWKHGYSSGVAMSDIQKVIIYWTVIW